MAALKFTSSVSFIRYNLIGNVSACQTAYDPVEVDAGHSGFLLVVCRAGAWLRTGRLAWPFSAR